MILHEPRCNELGSVTGGKPCSVKPHGLQCCAPLNLRISLTELRGSFLVLSKPIGMGGLSLWETITALRGVSLCSRVPQMFKQIISQMIKKQTDQWLYSSALPKTLRDEGFVVSC